MAYRIKRNESVPEAVRRIAGEEINSISSQLAHATGKRRDEAIHEARKSVKKTRALLRLVRPGLEDAYRVESEVLRDVGRTLSELRDAGSVIEILGKLQEKYPARIERSAANPIRRVLLQKKEEGEKRANLTEMLHDAAVKLRAMGKRVRRWPIGADGFAAIEDGFETTLRSGRGAFRLAKDKPRPENYHEWRKRLKDHWYHVRLLENLWTEIMLGYEASLKDVETWLGDDHNLVLLRERLMAEPDRFGPQKSIAPILDHIEKYQKELRDNAEALGERIYEEKPARFVRRIRQLWRDWQTEPKSLEEFEKAVRKDRKAA